MSRTVCEHFNRIDLPCDQCDERGFPNALFLARELNASIGTQSTHSTMKQAAAELRLLHSANEQLRAQNTELDAACAKLEAELAEQARLNGMGGEREARLMALNAELVDALRVAVKLNGFREFNDHIPAMKAALAKAGVSK